MLAKYVLILSTFVTFISGQSAYDGVVILFGNQHCIPGKYNCNQIKLQSTPNF